MPEFLTLEQVIEIHDDLIKEFGGLPGIANFNLLESAIAQPQASFSGDYLHPDVASQAAAYLYHLCCNHAFLDGNKRTATAATLTFLEANGYRLTLSPGEIFDLVIGVATSQVSKKALTEAIASSLIELSLE
jgi:death-on-curing protein